MIKAAKQDISKDTMKRSENQAPKFKGTGKANGNAYYLW